MYSATKAYLLKNQILFKTYLFPYAGMLLKSAALNCKWLGPPAGRHWNVNLFSIGVACLVSLRHIDLLFGPNCESHLMWAFFGILSLKRLFLLYRDSVIHHLILYSLNHKISLERSLRNFILYSVYERGPWRYKFKIKLNCTSWELETSEANM